MNIQIEYDGSYPNLCRGWLIVTIDGVVYDFGEFCLESGGRTYFSDNYTNSHILHGEWTISNWPDNFPEELKDSVIEAINNKITHGCCGGCL